MQKCLKVLQKKKKNKAKNKERKNPEEFFGRDEHPSITDDGGFQNSQVLLVHKSL